MMAVRFAVTSSILALALPLLIKSAGIYERCTVDTDCSVLDTTCRRRDCVGNICLCDVGYRSDNRGEKCLREKHYQEACNVTRDVCVGRGMYCNFQTNTCLCSRVTYISEDGVNCLATFNHNSYYFLGQYYVYLSGACGSDRLCALSFEQSCTNGTCTCIDGWRPSTTEELNAYPLPNQCRRHNYSLDEFDSSLCSSHTFNLNDVCTYDIQCPENARCVWQNCSRRVCACDDGFFANVEGTACLQVFDFPPNCSTTTETTVADAFDCSDLLSRGFTTDGIYQIYPYGNGTSTNVYCDQTTNGGGWLLFQKRMDGSEDFYRTWEEYENGFGEMTGEFWLGLKLIHLISTQRAYELLVDLEDFNNRTAYAAYDSFLVANSSTQYELFLGNYSGNAGDSLKRHSRGEVVHDQSAFSTKDRDNSGCNCAVNYKGGFWYGDKVACACHFANPNGLYLNGTNTLFGQSMEWDQWTGRKYSLKRTELKIRPRSL